MSTINITLNGQAHTVAGGICLADALRALVPDVDNADAPIATAVNGRHIARQARADYVLSDQDAITTFEPITGG
ncbi:sulfur carrier protein ThiS [Allopusillimonas ginsengisoli]|uniref:sulfur carrier protein ThiS n=1 Tax=Allopusillimonas ginsengisoli TaxID=453575 RepID=UPI0010C23C82|nr:MoaD/ThiS family protein [Allopusillimonas ginsengisoli]